MSTEGERITERFLDRCEGLTERGNLKGSGRLYAGTLLTRGADHSPPALFSYGAHFPLAVWVDGKRRRKGFRSRPLVVMNGDRWTGGWGTTSRHQDLVRTAVARRNVDTILIPFSALDGAGIDVTTIEPVHVRPDKTWTEDRSSEHYADVPRWHNTRQIPVERMAARIDQVPSQYVTHQHVGPDGRTWSQAPFKNAEGDWEHRYTCDAGETLLSYAEMHAAGVEYRVTAPVASPDGLFLYMASRSVPIERGDDGLYHWAQSMHRLGDSLFSADTVTESHVFDGRNEQGEAMTRRQMTRRRLFLSSFDMNEPRQLYFLAEVPRGAAARTVEQAIDSLAPRAVHAAIAQGRHVYRQGDVFAVAVPLTDAQVYGRAKTRARLTQWSRGARARPGEIGYVAPLTARELERFRVDVRKRYREIRARQWESSLAVGPGMAIRAGMSLEGSGGVYYRHARDKHRAFYGANARQALRDATRDIRYGPRWRARHEGQNTLELRRDALRIHGTAHTATEVVTCPGGVTYIRGIMRHEPAIANEGRERDHISVTLGNRTDWYVAIRNTVPSRTDGRPIGGPLGARW